MSAYDPIDQEPIWAALLALLKAKLAGSYLVMSRHHVRPPTLVQEMQPALFLVQARDTYAPRPAGLPTKLTPSGFIIIYFQAPQLLLEDIGAETIVGDTQLNALTLGVRRALMPDDPIKGKLTLGGLVEHCWIEGDSDRDGGIQSTQGAAILPIRMLIP